MKCSETQAEVPLSLSCTHTHPCSCHHPGRLLAVLEGLSPPWMDPEAGQSSALSTWSCWGGRGSAERGAMENSCGAQQRARTNARAGKRAVALLLGGIPAAGTLPCLGKWGSNKIPFLCGCCAHPPGSSSVTAGVLESFPLGKSGFYSSLEQLLPRPAAFLHLLFVLLLEITRFLISYMRGCYKTIKSCSHSRSQVAPLPTGVRAESLSSLTRASSRG